jgi:cytochrome c5|tara:strand:- start:6 stop:434 length:429 start_codon:yes stop_codon:yes gene_type:complete
MPTIKLNKNFSFLLVMFLMISYYSCEKKEVVNIYESEEYKTLTKKDLNSGEAIWAVACFRCHMFGTNGAVLLDEKEYWDATASKGIDKLFESVWEGKEGEYGIMPAKGFCNLCSEEEIKNSVFYIFHLAKKVQAANKSKINS